MFLIYLLNPIDPISTIYQPSPEFKFMLLGWPPTPPAWPETWPEQHRSDTEPWLLNIDNEWEWTISVTDYSYKLL